jgi:hypothetical protein
MKSIFLILAAAIAFSLAFSNALAEAKSCKKELAGEIFKYFRDTDMDAVNCDNYVYRFFDLNKDEEDDVIVYKKQFSCTPKGCDSEIFLFKEGKFANVGTLPGRYEVLKTVTKGFLDISVWASNNQLVLYKWNGNQYAPENFSTPQNANPTPANDPWNALP